MEDKVIYELFKEYATVIKIMAFNEGFEKGREAAKEQYDGK